MSLTVTIDLPDELASRFVALLPEEERSQFSVDAIAEALQFRQEEDCAKAAEEARQQRIAEMAAESLQRMQDFPSREEQFIAAIRKSKS